MGKLRYFSMLAALGLAGAAHAQTQAAPDQPGTQSNAPASPSSQSSPGSQDTGPGSASSPHQRDVTSQQAEESPPNENPDPSAASSPHQQNSMRMAEAGGAAARSVQPGMTVQAPSGESLGTVVDLVPGPTGSTESGYVVIASSGGSATPVPYAAASSMIQNGKIVVERTRLESAPKVQQRQLEDRSSKSWQSKADKYWGVHAGSDTDRSSSGPGRMRPDQSRPMEPNDSSNPPQK